MLKKLVILLPVLFISSCTSYEEITEATELLINRKYSNIECQYEANDQYSKNIKALCDYDLTLVFKATDSKNVVKTLAVCSHTKKVHLLSQELNNTN